MLLKLLFFFKYVFKFSGFCGFIVVSVDNTVCKRFLICLYTDLYWDGDLLTLQSQNSLPVFSCKYFSSTLSCGSFLNLKYYRIRRRRPRPLPAATSRPVFHLLSGNKQPTCCSTLSCLRPFVPLVLVSSLSARKQQQLLVFFRLANSYWQQPRRQIVPGAPSVCADINIWLRITKTRNTIRRVEDERMVAL